MSEVEDYVSFYNWRTAVQDLLLPDERRHTAAVRAAGGIGHALEKHAEP